ncbi:MAG: ABC transporter ATP-binding protein [Flavobacterium sp.]|jgi:phospholipid/cholesterol/gamma-HCH transport system ATP-binding protein|uniref:ABC transporter ATP-binding protein n=1 Tax=Flavobacterium cheonhonense TaxID=706185 RepID=A0ABP7TLJ3_9FLAO|nr:MULTISPECIES: ATP-binding cassette domain-containing protein [Flavobacterium]MBA4133211.1 ABC transporter ATP-binding protein [Flavobacterium sp.]PJE44515.1 MAG: ABC transporter ATP-binding protein [Flavobacterium sp.] [Flavobacterium sp. FEMGT703F]
MEKKPIITIENLHKSFGDNCVLDGFNMQLYEGENLVIMGKSGSGKSVMIKCLIGLEEPDSGTITVMGKNINQLEQAELDELRTEIGFLFQGSALYDSMSVRENLEFPLRRHTKKFGIIKDTTPMVMEALENVGLAHAIDLMPSELSGGMKRRIALARTLILQPKIILYDEPTTGLDPITSKEIILLMMSIQKKYNTSSIIITHDVDCARVIANRMILLIDSINYAEGTFETLSASEDPKIKAFFK